MFIIIIMTLWLAYITERRYNYCRRMGGPPWATLAQSLYAYRMIFRATLNYMHTNLRIEAIFITIFLI